MSDKNKVKVKGSRDKGRTVAPDKSLDRFDISHVRRGEDRIAMSASYNLGGVTVPEGMHGRWAQDKDGRIEQLMQAGYQVHKDGKGQYIKRSKGEFPMYLMLQPLALRKLDLDKKAERTNNVLREKVRLAPGEYVPGSQDGTQEFVIQKDRDKPYSAESDFDPLSLT